MIRVRINYRNLSDTLQETTSNFVCGKMICKAYYDKSSGEWYILNLVNNRRVMGGKNKSEDDAKRMIKRSLRNLGANFFDEVRRKSLLTEENFDEIVEQKEGK